MKSLVTSLEGWEGGARPLALLPAETLSVIGKAGGLDWLPVGLNLQVTEAVYDGLGAAGADRFFRAHSLASFDGPILQTMVTTAVRMFGLDPVSFARWVPRAWHMIFRETGAWRVPEAPPAASSLVLTLEGLPPECADHQVWHRSVSRSISALFDLARVPGVANVQPRTKGEREVRFSLRWEPRGVVEGPPPA